MSVIVIQNNIKVKKDLQQRQQSSAKTGKSDFKRLYYDLLSATTKKATKQKKEQTGYIDAIVRTCFYMASYHQYFYNVFCVKKNNKTSRLDIRAIGADFILYCVRLTPNWTNVGLFKISFSTFWLGEPKCTATDLKKVPDLFHLGPI